jgi:hypothetical protein
VLEDGNGRTYQVNGSNIRINGFCSFTLIEIEEFSAVERVECFKRS